MFGLIGIVLIFFIQVKLYKEIQVFDVQMFKEEITEIEAQYNCKPMYQTILALVLFQILLLFISTFESLIFLC